MFITSDLARAIPLPKRDANKYSRGKCVLIAGSRPYPGAACLAARASQYVGAGYSEVFTARQNVTLIQAARSSLVVRTFDECDPKRLFSSGHPGAVVFGSGIDASDKKARALFLQTVRKVKHPLVLDGGALAFAASGEGRGALAMRAEKQRVTILTPHLGEAQRLAKPFKISLDDPYRAAAELAVAYDALIALKGPETIISNGIKTEIFADGTPVLAKAGTGDVLAGIIGGLSAQGLAPLEAAMLGVALHAKAGKLSARSFTEVSVCAEEVIESIPEAIASFLVIRDQER